jgi:hypothetical protein
MLWKKNLRIVGVAAAAVLLGLSLGSCGDGNGPNSGVLLLRLDTPNDDDRAVRVVIQGFIQEITPAANYEIFKGTPGASSSVILIRKGRQRIGRGGEVVARVTVDDITAALNYAVNVQEAAAADYDVRTPLELANYLAELIRQ